MSVLCFHNIIFNIPVIYYWIWTIETSKYNIRLRLKTFIIDNIIIFLLLITINSSSENPIPTHPKVLADIVKLMVSLSACQLAVKELPAWKDPLQLTNVSILNNATRIKTYLVEMLHNTGFNDLILSECHDNNITCYQNDCSNKAMIDVKEFNFVN